MKMNFELQRFAEAEESTESAEKSAEQKVSEPSIAEGEEKSRNIPPELEGLDEEYIDAALKEYEQLQKEQPTDTAVESAPDKAKESNEAVSYEQYKAKIEEVERYKAKLDEMQRQRQVPVQQPPPSSPQVQPQIPQIQMTPQAVAMLKQAVEQEAMRMTGLTREDIAGFEFSNEDDPNVERWKYAKQMAQENVFATIRQAQLNQLQQQQQFLQRHRANVASYNEFASREMAEPDFRQIQRFAMNEYFTTLSPQDRKTISNAYLRIERQTAEPTDTLLIRIYYQNAKAAYRNEQAGAKVSNANKVRQANNLPKVDQISGTAQTPEGMTAAELEKLIDKGIENVPKKYQKMFEEY